MFIYKNLRKIYWKLRGLIEKVLGTRLWEKRWANRNALSNDDWGNNKHLLQKNGWIFKYWDSQDHSHRKFLLENIEKFYPFSSILEIGSNCGPNLVLIAKKFPKIKIVGIDINKKAIDIGKNLMVREGITNVELYQGKADELNKFTGKSFDIIFTDATLIYIGPDKIYQVLKEIARLARKAIVFLEQYVEGEEEYKALGIYQFGLWKRNYKNMLKKFFAEEQIKIIKLPNDAWDEKGWKESGILVEVRL